MKRQNKYDLIYIGMVAVGLLTSLWGCPTKAAAETNFTTKHYNVVKAIIWAADKVEVPRELLLSLCWGESSFRLHVSHMDGPSVSYGVCQVKLETAQWMDKIYKHKFKATPKKLENPKYNAFYAAKYLKYQLNRYNYDWKLAIDAYNKHNAKSRHSPYVRKFNRSQTFIRSHVDTVAFNNETF